MPSDDLHVDDETLALLALGERAEAADLEHVARCTRCSDEVSALRAVTELARESGDVELVAPPAHVWDRVAAELGLGERAHVAAHGGLRAERPATGSTSPPPAGTDAPRPSAAAPAAGSSPAQDPAPHGAEPSGDVASVTPLRPRRHRGAWIAAAAAAGLVVGGAGAAAVLRGVDDRSTLDASAVLEPLPGWSETGRAEVRTASDGSRSLVVDLDRTPSNQGFLEVWLLKPDVSGLVSLGTMEGTTGVFTLPAGIDLEEFPVVDVSDEPFDGDPAHSGDSVVRGALDV